MPLMRATVYLRISEDKKRDDEDLKELGVARQREDAMALIDRRGWTFVREYVDNDLSAKGNVVRPAFEAMMKDAERGEFEVIVVWTIDRLTRNRRDDLRIVEVCQPREMTIAAVRGSDMDMSTPAGRMTADILAAVARNEIEQKGDRQRRAALQAAEQGRPPGGRVGFGFMPDRIHLHPEQSAAIRDAYDHIIGGGSLATIARKWNAAGLLSGQLKRGRYGKGEPSQWRAETVRSLLLLPRNCGLRAYRGEIMGPGDQEAIVTEDVWRTAVAILSSPARKGRAPSPQYLLSGVALCGVCGHTVNAGSRMPRYGYAYRCGQTNGHVARRGDWIDDYVSEFVIARMSRSDAHELLIDDDGPDVPALHGKAKALREQIDALAVEFGNADPDDVLTATREFRIATQGLRKRLSAVEADLVDAGRVSVFGPLVGVDDVGAAWADLEADRKRVVIDALMVVRLLPVGRGTRTFDPDTVEIERKR